MAKLGLERSVVDSEVYGRTLGRFREAGVVLPTLGQLRDPATIPPAIRGRLTEVDPDARHPLNLFRVHWFNDAQRVGLSDVPAHIELPQELTGVPARIALAGTELIEVVVAGDLLEGVRLVLGRHHPLGDVRDRRLPAVGRGRRHLL